MFYDDENWVDIKELVVITSDKLEESEKRGKAGTKYLNRLRNQIDILNGLTIVLDKYRKVYEKTEYYLDYEYNFHVTFQRTLKAPYEYRGLFEINVSDKNTGKQLHKDYISCVHNTYGYTALFGKSDYFIKPIFNFRVGFMMRMFKVLDAKGIQYLLKMVLNDNSFDNC